jgi:hypothetical protein
MRAVITTSAVALAAAIVAAGATSVATGTDARARGMNYTSAAAPTTGIAPRLTIQSSAEPIETPSGTYLPITRATFGTTVPGPMTVRFSGTAHASDWTGPDARFVGRSYAALLVRVLLDGTPLAPGAVVFGDNTGKISVNAARPKAASFEWAKQVPAGSHRLEVQFRNRRTWDIGGITRWSLVIQHP